jgi:hypothetical protein
MFAEFTYTAYNYSIFHKPTGKWVSFEQDYEYGHLFAIALVDDFGKADKFNSEEIARIRLESSYMFKDMYGKKKSFRV